MGMPSNPYIYQAIAVKHGLLLYVRSGIKPNTHWTPAAMLRTAGQITKQKYKRGEYLRAANDLQYWVDNDGSMS